jgi:hypothetical protein
MIDREVSSYPGERGKLGLKVSLWMNKGQSGDLVLSASGPLYHSLFNELSGRLNKVQSDNWGGSYFNLPANLIDGVNLGIPGVELDFIDKPLLLKRGTAINMSWLRHTDLDKGIEIKWAHYPLGIGGELKSIMLMISNAARELYATLAKQQHAEVEIYLKEAA